MKVHRVTPEAAVPAGEQFFVGEVRVQPVVPGSEGIEIIVVRFSAGARTYLHSHEVPQVLHCIEGRGILATEISPYIIPMSLSTPTVTSGVSTISGAQLGPTTNAAHIPASTWFGITWHKKERARDTLPGSSNLDRIRIPFR